MTGNGGGRSPSFIRLTAYLVALLATLSVLGPHSSNLVQARSTASSSRPSLVAKEALGWDRSQVRFDNYSLFLRDQRVFLHGGEFHTFRLPVPSLWPDIIQKVKAAGMNSISVYIHMGLVNPSRGVIELEGFRALQPLFDAARTAGIWIVFRPGPYINAESTAGGMAHWTTAEVQGHLRTNATDWKEAWIPYVEAMVKAGAPNQIGNNGPIIAWQVDNEFGQDPAPQAEYFADLEDYYHQSPVTVPLTYNDPGPRRSFINGTGAVDLYGMDDYPQRYNCSAPDVWQPVPTTYHSYHADANPSQVWYIPEFQGGSFDAWGPTSPGYEGCRELTGPQFEQVFYHMLWASNAKMISYYMFYGGTSWGALPFPGVYTSYDYGSAIKESRELTSKYDEIKRQGLFLRSSPEFYKTDWIADTLTGLDAAVSSTRPTFATFLRNPDTGAGFYIVRQNDSSITTPTEFTINVQSSIGSLRLPLQGSSISLNGRQSKLVLTDYAFGSSRLLYTTAQVLFAGVIDGRDVLFLYGDQDQEHEVVLPLTGVNRMSQQSSSFTLSQNSSKIPSSMTTAHIHNSSGGLTTIWDSDKQLILFADTATAATFWSPTIAGKASDPLKNYWGIGTNQSVLVAGPYLVREAEITGSTLAIQGDLKADTKLTVIAPRTIRSITWNGQSVAIDRAASSSITSIGGFVGQLHVNRASLPLVTAPKLGGWKYQDSLPEIGSSFDDRSWTVANKTETNSPFKPYYGDGRALYGCDYGFCENIVLWRGHFNAIGVEKSVNLSINGGEAFAATVWLNDVFLNTSYGNSTNNRHVLEETDDKFVFPEGALKIGKDNVITVVQDNMGLNETGWGTPENCKSPRGIRGFMLDSGNFTTWKVQGKVGGYKNYVDKARGVLNEGGLFGERKGWHLPGFDTSRWLSRELSQGLPNSAAGVGFFVTTFELSIPQNFDVAMSFTFTEALGQPYRAILFVNGWMMGKRVGNLGPQAKFPVHQGILNYNGLNTVAVALWAMEPDVTIKPNLELDIDGIYEGGVGRVVSENPSWNSAGRF